MSLNSEKRYKFNSWMFIITYAIAGLLAGVALEALVTFLDASEATKGLAASTPTFMGIGFAAGAALLIFIPKAGFKSILALASIASIVGLIAVYYVTVVPLIAVAVAIIFIGVCLYDAILPSFLTSYTTEEDRPKFFSRAIYTNVIGMALATFCGGPLIASRFASRLNLDYSVAKALTQNAAAFTEVQKQAYVSAHKDILLIFAFVAVACLIPTLMVKQRPEDYKETNKEKKKEKFNWAIFKNKYIVLFLVFTFLIRFGAGLICPFFPIFLGKLGIDRATVSILNGLQYIAMASFAAFSPWLVKKLGKVLTVGVLSLMAIPFMLLIVNGQLFGNAMVYVVGAALFLRSGFANAASPVQQALPMEFVSKEERPAYSAVIFIVMALGQVAAGQFSKGVLLKFENGYSIAYYITGAIYIVGSTLLITVFTKKYNRPKATDEELKKAS